MHMGVKIKRPIKWTADRTQAFLSDAHGRDHINDIQLALDANNKILGLRVDTLANLGAYLSRICENTDLPPWHVIIRLL